MSKSAELSAKLSRQFLPYFIHVENESHLHSSGRGADSHFKVVLVSDEFEGKRLVARHRMVYQLLAEELENGIHALALHTYTLPEWQQTSQKIPQSIDCAGVGH